MNKNYLNLLREDPIVRIASDASNDAASKSLAIPAIWSAITLGTGFMFGGGEVNGISYHLIDLSACVGLFIVFVLARIFEFSWKHSGFKVWITAGLFALAVNPIIILLRDGYLDESYRNTIPIGIIAYPMLTVLIGVICTNFTRLRSEAKQLNIRYQELVIQSQSLDEDVATIDSELRMEIRNRLEAYLARYSLNQITAESIKETIDNLGKIVNLIVRPLASEVNKMDSVDSINNRLESRPHPPAAGDDIRLEKSKVELGALISIVFYSICLMIFVVPTSYIVYGLPGLMCVLITTVIDIFVLITIKSRFGERRLIGPVAVGSLAMVSGIIGLSYLMLGKFLATDTQFGIGIPTGFLLIGLLVSVYLWLVARKEESLISMTEITEKKAKLVALLKQKVWVSKRNLSHVIHGKIQSRFIASALRLSNAEVIDKELIESVRDEIQNAVDSLTLTDSNTNDVNEGIKDIQDTWEGVCLIDVTMDQRTLELVNQYPYACISVQEILIEAIANAVKYTGADRAEVLIEVTKDENLAVTVSSYGNSRKEAGGQPGLGSNLLDDVTLHWNLETSANSSRLEALVPIK